MLTLIRPAHFGRTAEEPVEACAAAAPHRDLAVFELDRPIADVVPLETRTSVRRVRWCFPASPGNSGGPLIDAAGRVLGVVVRKSQAEKLNFAVPIDELVKLREDQGDLSRRGMTIAEDHHEARVDWSFHPRLPLSPGDLAEHQARL